MKRIDNMNHPQYISDFNKIGGNIHGYVTLNDMNKLAQIKGIIPDEKYHELVEKFDVNFDGKIDWNG